MRLVALFFYLILLVDCIEGSNGIKLQYDVEELHSEFQSVLDNALLNPNGTTIVKIGRERIVDLKGSGCTQDVLNNLTNECLRMTNQARSTISIMYLTCIMNDIDVEIPPACRNKQSWLSWSRTTCAQALVKDTSMWTTYDGFYRDIDAVCFAHTFNEKLQRIETGTVELIETGQNVMTGIAGLVKQVFNFQLQTMPYLHSIENGVRNTLKEVSSLTTIVSKLYNLTERIADRVDVILDDLENVNGKVNDISSAIDSNTIALDTMNVKMMDVEKRFQNFFEILEMCLPFITFTFERIIIICNPISLLLFSCMSWVWWYHLHGAWFKLFSIAVICTLEQISRVGLWYTLNQIPFNVLKHTSSYIIITVCFFLTLVFVFFYRLFSYMYVRRRSKSRRSRLEQTCSEHWNTNVY